MSGVKCTICNDGFYGVVCNIPCSQNCSSGECHQKYGHCTYGCQDGQFATDDRAKCLSCPDNCGVCSNVSNCATCVNNWYGPICSLTCPDTCAGGTCTQYTGHCLQCKNGYHWLGGTCLQCPGECISCANVTHCIECQNMYLGPFQGKCFRKCYTNTKNSVSKPYQICGFPPENAKEKQTSCLKIKVGRRYSCTTKGYCIDCGPTWNNSSNRTADDGMCVRHERCSIECKPESQNQTIKRQGAAAEHALCKETCPISYDNDRETQQVCLKTTKYITTSSLQEHIECSQEPEGIANSPEGRSTLTTVTVVFGCLVFLLLIWRVMYEQKQSCTMSTRRSRSTEVAQQFEPNQRYCDLPGEVQNTTTLPRSPTVENVYDRAKFVTERRINKEIPSYRCCRQDSVYDTANCSNYIAGDRMNIMLPAPSYPIDIPIKLYDTSNCSHLNKDVCMNTMFPASQHHSEIQDTSYSTASYSHLNKCDRMNTILPAPPYPRVIQDTVYDTASCSHLNKCDRMNTMLPASSYPTEIQDNMNNTSDYPQLVNDTREYETVCFPTQCNYIPGSSYNALNPGPSDHMNNSPASQLQGSD